MKTLAAFRRLDNAGKTDGFGILAWPDSALVKSGKPIFVPDYEAYSAVIGFGVRIKAVGKSIKGKFATRYYDDLLPMAFILPGSSARRVEKGEDPYASEIVADCSVISGDESSAARMLENGELDLEWSLTPLREDDRDTGARSATIRMSGAEADIRSAIEEASRLNTLKTGDIVAVLIPVEIKIDRDSLLRIKLKGELLLENKLK